MQVFDIHAHIYPDNIAERAVRNISQSYDDFPVQNDGTLKTLMAELDRAGTTRAAIHSVATTPRQVGSINRFVLESAAAHPGRLIPFATLHPDTPDLEDTVDEIVKAGFRGVKLHPEFQGFKVDDKRALRLFDTLAGRLPVLLHCGDFRCDNSVPERIKHMLEQIHGLDLVCAHLGGWTTWEISAIELRGVDVWVDTSSSLYVLDPPTATAIVKSYGVERVLYGTDYPMWHADEELERFMTMRLTDDEREDILWNNHLRLFKGEL